MSLDEVIDRGVKIGVWEVEDDQVFEIEDEGGHKWEEFWNSFQ